MILKSEVCKYLENAIFEIVLKLESKQEALLSSKNYVLRLLLEESYNFKLNDK